MAPSAFLKAFGLTINQRNGGRIRRMLGAEWMQSGRWALFMLDLIGGGAVAAALIYVATFRRRRSQAGRDVNLAE
jgi:hypothetical protein